MGEHQRDRERLLAHPASIPKRVQFRRHPWLCVSSPSTTTTHIDIVWRGLSGTVNSSGRKQGHMASGQLIFDTRHRIGEHPAKNTNVSLALTCANQISSRLSTGTTNAIGIASSLETTTIRRHESNSLWLISGGRSPGKSFFFFSQVDKLVPCCRPPRNMLLPPPGCG